MIVGDPELYITTVVIAEVAHVLRQLYQVPREEIVDRLVEFLRLENVSTFRLDKVAVIDALLRCRPSGRVSIPDALIWAEVRSSNTPTIYRSTSAFRPMASPFVRS